MLKEYHFKLGSIYMPRIEAGEPCSSRSLLPLFSLYFQHLFEGENLIILLYSLAARDQNGLCVFSIFQQLVRPISCSKKEGQATANCKTSYWWFQQDEIYLHSIYYGKVSLNRSKWKHLGGGGDSIPASRQWPMHAQYNTTQRHSNTMK